MRMEIIIFMIGFTLVIGAYFLISSLFQSTACELLNRCLGMEGFLKWVYEMTHLNYYAQMALIAVSTLMFIFGGLFVIVSLVSFDRRDNG